MRGRSRAIYVAAAIGVALLLGAAFVSRDADPAEQRSGAAARGTVEAHAAFVSQARRVPPPPRPAFTFGRVPPLRPSAGLARWSAVVTSVPVRPSPSPAAPRIATLAPETSLGTTNIVLVIGEADTRDGLWVRIRLPILPNTTTGWVPRSALGGYQFVATHLVVDRARLVATLLRGGRPVFRAAVGIGKPEWPTPPGKFYVREKLVRFKNAFYGPIAFGTSARSSVLTDWPEGGFIGIHGTSRPDLLPGRVSHGCIRMRNDDILRLSRLMPVGTPLTII